MAVPSLGKSTDVVITHDAAPKRAWPAARSIIRPKARKSRPRITIAWKQQLDRTPTPRCDREYNHDNDHTRPQHKGSPSMSPRPNTHDRPVCPVAPNMNHKADKEFSAIRGHYSSLADTSCTAQFCQGGRMIHTTEPRIGYDRPLSEIQDEAKDFLSQLRRDEVIQSDKELEVRAQEALESLPHGTWHHTFAELEHGIRLAWKHSRRCIMRSEWKNLALCDLRRVKTSAKMGSALIEHAKLAFNKGDIKPTVFAFPPRSRGKTGPLVWNHQILGFAGYRQEDGSILGDPANAAVTDAIIELGWQPPAVKTKWDILPLVTQAEDDEPAITCINEDDFPPVYIRHPQHSLAFDRLGLRWVPAPALSRLGFDIGGVQYTAAPFIGWFMDAEIGVRDLVDEFRYNALPSIVEALGLIRTPGKTLDELPDYERLACLSRAQTELNYAVYWSFNQAGVRMSDSLSASSMYCNFDDEHLSEHGFRLPADPYWLSPPIGSIAPIWHRGGAPNYQPKPLIARHVQDPLNAYRRSKGLPTPSFDIEAEQTPQEKLENIQSIRVAYCSSGTIAAKLAKNVQSELRKAVPGSMHEYHIAPATILNDLEISEVGPSDILLIIASSCGRGHVPANGRAFLRKLQGSKPDTISGGVKFSIFGNGSVSYADSYNGAARDIETALKDSGAVPLLPLFDSDADLESPPWSNLQHWFGLLRGILFNDEVLRQEDVAPSKLNIQPADIKARALQTLTEECTASKIISCTGAQKGIKHVVLDIGNISYTDVCHIDIFVPNDAQKVTQIHELLPSAKEKQTMPAGLTLVSFLTDFVNLDRPFTDTAWAGHFEVTSQMEQLAIRETLQLLPHGWQDKVDMAQLIAAMPLRPPRHYSVASSQAHLDAKDDGNRVELLVQAHEGGLFSDNFLSSKNVLNRPLQVRFKQTPLAASLLQTEPIAPVIAFVTGSGMAPLRSYLQARIHNSQQSKVDEATPAGPVTVLVAFKTRDSAIVSEMLDQAQKLGIIDIIIEQSSGDDGVTASPQEKGYVQDQIFEPQYRSRILVRLRDPKTRIFICANSRAAKGFEKNLTAWLGADVRATFGERYVEEVFDAAG